MSGEPNWCLIESDPGVFTELITRMGAKDVQVEEVYALDEEVMKQFEQIYGLIFLFKWEKGDASSGNGSGVLESQDDAGGEHRVFFAHQVIQNACATQAILSILLNRPEIELSDELRQFKEFTLDLPPDMRGLAISNSESIRQIHNSFSPQESITNEVEPSSSTEGEAFHFISYVPINGRLYELDGLKPHPIVHSEYTNSDWISRAITIIQSRMEQYSSSEIRFSLMVLIKDWRKIYQEQLALLDVKAREIESELNKPGLNQEEQARLNAILTQSNFESSELRSKIAHEEQKHEQAKRDNIRRKHNYIPLIYQLVRGMAVTGSLDKVIEASREQRSKDSS
ncbi:hypothetical protein EV182_002004 [Spiromyces aspiralis]|uniref:Uncharacterized protein n=1 Tax=Spiromyces aspiralis TaxID=68401 RepID=A0ACC1HF21_9FUNG|nr:hypothetical protein EV182_002004 [Spiromyces aspiralis]